MSSVLYQLSYAAQKPNSRPVEQSLGRLSVQVTVFDQATTQPVR